jgi:hypothetical protein
LSAPVDQVARVPVAGTWVVLIDPIVVHDPGAAPAPYSSWYSLNEWASVACPVIVTSPASGRLGSGNAIAPAGAVVSTSTLPDVVAPVLPAELVSVWIQR